MSTFLLRPFSALYGGLLSFRNYLYDRQIKSTFSPQQRTISVGNLTVGGTGKTPMIEFLVRKLLSGNYRTGETPECLPEVATLSRGYGRQTTGFRLANPSDTAETIGDEPLQLYQKFGDQIKVAVAERRAEGLQQLSRQCPSVQVVLLDDAFQHRAVKPHLNILLTDYNRPFFHDHPFPEGRLREQRTGAKRADVIVVTKCPYELTLSETQRIIDEITPYKDTDAPIFFTGIVYGAPKGFGSQTIPADKKTSVSLISGLANADLLERYVQETFSLVRHYRFNDHYNYSRGTIERIMRELPTGAVVLTTEKDWVKLAPLLTTDEQATLPLYYLPLTVRFLENEAAFLDMVRSVVHPKNA